MQLRPISGWADRTRRSEASLAPVHAGPTRDLHSGVCGNVGLAVLSCRHRCIEEGVFRSDQVDLTYKARSARAHLRAVKALTHTARTQS
jgi:hypothetical protein